MMNMKTLADKSSAVSLVRLSGLDRWSLPLLFGFAPLITMLVTWPAPGALTASSALLRGLTIPLLNVEILTIILAMLLPGAAKPRLPAHMTVLLAILGVVVFGTAIFASIEQDTALMRSFLWVIHVLFGWSLYKLALARRVSADQMADAIFAGAIAAAVATLIFAWSAPSAGFDWISGMPGYDNIRRLGYYMAAVAGLAAGRMAMRQGKWPHALPWLAATFAFAMIFWSGSRGGVIATVAAVAGLALLIPQMRSVKLWVSLMASAGVGALISLTAPTSNPGMGLLRAIFTTTPTSSGAEMSSGRTTLWMQTLDAIAQRPIFGYGEGQSSFIMQMAIDQRLFHPHNALLQTLLAWGVVGTAIVLTLTLPWFLQTLWSARAGRQSLPWTCGITVLVLFSAIDGTLFHVLPVALVACFAAMAQATKSAPNSLDRAR